MLRATRILIFALLAGFVLTSCEKEYSEENGYLPGIGNSGTSVFTFDGAPAACASPIITGTYQTGTALNATNTVALTVNVSTAGTYNISTSTSNGFSFSGSGSFASTGAQIVILTGTGIPTAAVTTNFTPGTAGCSFTINVTPGSSGSDFLRCKIDGTLVNFVLMPGATITGNTLAIGGAVSSTSPESIEVDLIGATIFPTGTYQEENAVPGAPIYVEAGYIDPAVGIWYVDAAAPTPRPNPFTVVITSISATRIAGTFQGGLFDAGGGTTQKLITEGAFDLPLN
jgi:hypothetical protein